MVRIVADNMDSVLIDPALVVQINGRDGEDGERGQDGKDGRDGVDGKNGRDGRDGVDGKDGKNGVSFWIEYDAKTNTLVFKNDGGLKTPDPIKLPSAAKGWGFAAGSGRGGVTAQSDWNQTDKHAVDYIKNKPVIHNVRFLVVEELPQFGDQWTIYLVQEEDDDRGGDGNMYSEWIFVENEITHTLGWEKFGTEVDLSGYVKYTDVAGAGHISNKTATDRFLSPSTIDDVAAVSARSMYDNVIDVSGGTVNLSEGCVLYRSAPTANIAYTFSNSALTQTTDIPCVYFNLLVSMPSTPVSLDFTTNNTVTWVEDTTPNTSQGGKTYMFAFQSFDGGTTWVGSLATWWTTP